MAELRQQIAQERRRTAEILAATTALEQPPAVVAPVAPAVPEPAPVAPAEPEEAGPLELVLSEREVEIVRDGDERLRTVTQTANRIALSEESIPHLSQRLAAEAVKERAEQLVLAWESNNEVGATIRTRESIYLTELENDAEAIAAKVEDALLVRLQRKIAASSGGEWLLTAVITMG